MNGKCMKASARRIVASRPAVASDPWLLSSRSDKLDTAETSLFDAIVAMHISDICAGFIRPLCESTGRVCRKAPGWIGHGRSWYRLVAC
jgi:hypothetical protein